MQNFVELRANALMRQAMVRTMAKTLPCYTVCEFPKCGGTWLSQMLADALNLPFPRNRLPSLRPSIMHGHYLHPWGMSNVVVLWRDPRDVVVSQYYHSYFVNELYNRRLVQIFRSEMPFDNYNDVRTNLPAFIRRVYQNPIRPRFSYSQFIDNWHRRNDVVHTSYEALRTEPVAELQRVVVSLTGTTLDPHRAKEIAEANSFARVAKRPPGKESKASFLRSGIAGGWVQSFSPAARRAMHEMAQKDLERLGYELDSEWVEQGCKYR